MVTKVLTIKKNILIASSCHREGFLQVRFSAKHKRQFNNGSFPTAYGQMFRKHATTFSETTAGIHKSKHPVFPSPLFNHLADDNLKLFPICLAGKFELDISNFFLLRAVVEAVTNIVLVIFRRRRL